MHVLSREIINIAMQIRQRMRNELGGAPKLTEADLIDQLLAYAEDSADAHVHRLAERLRALLPTPEPETDSALHDRIYRGQPVTDAGISAPSEQSSQSATRKMYRGRPVD